MFKEHYSKKSCNALFAYKKSGKQTDNMQTILYI